MLRFHSTIAKGEVKVGFDAAALPPEVNWIDAMRPEPKEVVFLERILGLKVPTLREPVRDRDVEPNSTATRISCT